MTSLLSFGIFGPRIKVPENTGAGHYLPGPGFPVSKRAEVMQLKEEPFIEGLRCLDADSRLLLHHIILNIVNKLLILFTIRGTRYSSIAGLSFLGPGVQPPTPD